MLFSIQDLNKINNITFKEKLLLKKKKYQQWHTVLRKIQIIPGPK